MLRRLSSFWGADEQDDELRRLTRTVKKTMQVQKREVRGVSDVIFTVGKKETSAFKAENESRRARGEPYFVRLKNDVGSKEKMVVVWMKTSTDKDEFITDIVLASAQPNHEQFFFGDKDGYSLIVHPEMRGMGAADPTLCLWVKKEAGQSRFIADLRVSYTKDDHIDLTRKNYEMLPLCLSNFGLGYANVWILWTSSQIVRLTDSDHIEQELKDYTAMLSKNPEDKILIKMVDQAKWRLREAQLAEEDHARDIPGDDLTYTKEFLALKSTELNKMRSIFRREIDLDKDEKVSVEDYCSFLAEPLSMSPFIRQVFELSAPSNGRQGKYPTNNATPTMDAGATLKATAVFCMLCSADLLKFIFAWYDRKGYGVIDNKQFLELLGMFHPRHRDDVVVRALKEVDLPADGKMPFDKFENDCRRFPHLLYPAFRVQDKVRAYFPIDHFKELPFFWLPDSRLHQISSIQMRQRFFGARWWKRKLERYAEAKELLEEEQRKEQAMEDRERRQRYEVSEELKNESMELFEIRKRRKKKRR
ncbi:hypothetical protein ACHAWF_018875 [Thalassiosira exigua]